LTDNPDLTVRLDAALQSASDQQAALRRTLEINDDADIIVCRRDVSSH
jgi:hypothetical protein